jgi:CRISPR-associated endonuclease/helicase Cas3
MSDVKDEGFLELNHFEEFFCALHGSRPFAWQTRLAQDVLNCGWPVALDLPTGAGKTAVIDIAVFHLALEAHRRSERRAPVRILFVVDRRLIVDAAHHRADKIANKLEYANDGVLGRVATRLKLLAEDGGPPLRVAKLRGGAPKDPDWVRTPVQPTVVVSTVDQVGSRLLFRGYGVSNSMKPIHAGLLGADGLLLLDEAHLSQPFVQTAIDSRMFQGAGAWSDDKAPAPFGMITLSATLAPADAEKEPFRLADAERAEPQLAKRLEVGKPAALVDVSTRDLVDMLADRAWSISKVSSDDARAEKADEGKAAVVAVVVNRVARARAVFEALQKKGARPLRILGADPDAKPAPPDEAKADLALLIGRTRELERSKLTELLLERMKAGRDRSKPAVPLFVVATQTIEAGADLDFDALVTEVAPLDCLRQRFGRLDRLGEYGEAQAVIVAASDQVAKNAKNDPIYGEALKATWKLLTEKSGTRQSKKKKTKGKDREDATVQSGPTIDFGIAAAEAWLPSGCAYRLSCATCGCAGATAARHNVLDANLSAARCRSGGLALSSRSRRIG